MILAMVSLCLLSPALGKIVNELPNFLLKLNASTKPSGTLDHPFRLRMTVEIDETEFRWRDNRLAFDPAETEKLTSIHIAPDYFYRIKYGSIKMWIPQIYLMLDYRRGAFQREITIDSFGEAVFTMRFKTDYGCTYDSGDFPYDTYKCCFRYDHRHDNDTNFLENTHGGTRNFVKVSPLYRHSPHHYISNITSWKTSEDGWFWNEKYFSRVNVEVFVQRREAFIYERFIWPVWCLVALDVIFFVLGQGVWGGVALVPVYVTYLETFRLLVRDSAGNTPAFVRVVYSRLLSCFACNLLRISAYWIRNCQPDHPFGYSFTSAWRKLIILAAFSAFFYVVI